MSDCKVPNGNELSNADFSQEKLKELIKNLEEELGQDNLKINKKLVQGSKQEEIINKSLNKINNDLNLAITDGLYKKISSGNKAFFKNYRESLKLAAIENTKTQIRREVSTNLNKLTEDEIIQKFIYKNFELGLHSPSKEQIEEIEKFAKKTISDKSRFINNNLWSSVQSKNKDILDLANKASNEAKGNEQMSKRLFKEYLSSKLGNEDFVIQSFAENHGFKNIDELVDAVLDDESSFEQSVFYQDYFYELFQKNEEVQETKNVNNDTQSNKGDFTKFETTSAAENAVKRITDNIFNIHLVEEVDAFEKGSKDEVIYLQESKMFVDRKTLMPKEFQEVYSYNSETDTVSRRRHYASMNSVYNGVTSSIIGDKFSSNWTTPLNVGSEVDAILREFFDRYSNNNTEPLKLEDFKDENGKNWLTQKAFDELINSANVFLDQFKDRNVKFYTKNLFLKSDLYGIASELDILMIDKDNNTVHIFDFKTSKDKLIDKNNPDELSDKLKGYKRQLSAYKLMIAEMFPGFNVHVDGIIEINTNLKNGDEFADEANINPVIANIGYFNNEELIFKPEVIQKKNEKINSLNEKFNELKKSTEEYLSEEIEEKPSTAEKELTNTPQTKEDINNEVKNEQIELNSSLIPVEITKTEKSETIITDSINDVSIIDTEDIITNEGTKGVAQYNRSTNTIKLNRKLLKEKFDNKSWTNPRDLFEIIHGEKISSKVNPLPENQFKTYEEWEQFVINHEYQHSLYSREDFNKEFPNKTKGDYESEINRRALNQSASQKEQKAQEIKNNTNKSIDFIENYNENNEDQNSDANREDYGGRLVAGYLYEFKKDSQGNRIDTNPKIQEVSINELHINGEYVLRNNLNVGDEVFFEVDLDSRVNKFRLNPKQSPSGGFWTPLGNGKVKDSKTGEIRNSDTSGIYAVDDNGEIIDNNDQLLISVFKYDENGNKQTIGSLSYKDGYALTSGKYITADPIKDKWIHDLRDEVKQRVKDGATGKFVVDGWSSKIEFLSNGVFNKVTVFNKPHEVKTGKDGKMPLTLGMVLPNDNGTNRVVINASEDINNALKEQYGENFDINEVLLTQTDKFDINDEKHIGSVFMLIPSLDNKKMIISFLDKQIGKNIPGYPKKIDELISLVSDPNANMLERSMNLEELTKLGSFKKGTLNFDESKNKFVLDEGARVFDSVQNKMMTTGSINEYDPQELIDYILSIYPYIESDLLNTEDYNKFLSENGYIRTNLNAGFPIVNTTIAIEPGVKSNINKVNEGNEDSEKVITHTDSNVRNFDDFQLIDDEESSKDDDSVYSLTDSIINHSNLPRNKVSIEQARFWLTKNFPQIPLEVVNSIIIMSKNGAVSADGVFRDALIKLSKEADSSVVYHEAAHAAFRMFNTERQQKMLIDEAKEKFEAPSLYDIEELSNIFPNKDNNELIDIYYEEKIMEDFRSYIMSIENNQEYNSIGKAISDFFKRLYYFFKNIVTENISLDEFYNKANTGYYANKKANDRYTEKIRKSPAYSYSYQFTEAEMHEATKALASNAALIILNSKDKNDLNSDPYAKFQNANQLKKLILQTINESLNKAVENYNEKGDELKAARMNDLIDKFLTFDYKNKTVKLNSPAKKIIKMLPNISDVSSLLDIEETLYEIDEDVQEENDAQNLYVERNLVSPWKKTSTELKLYFLSLPKLDLKGNIKRTSNGHIDYNDPSVVFKKIIEGVSNSVDNKDAQDTLKKMAEKDMTIALIYSDLFENQNMRRQLGLKTIPSINEIRNKFYFNISTKVLDQVINIHSFEYKSKEGSNKNKLVPYQANKNDLAESIISIIPDNLNEDSLINKDGEPTIDSALKSQQFLSEIKKVTGSLIEEYNNSNKSRKLKSNESKEILDLVKRIIDSIGVNIDNSVLKKSIYSTSDVNSLFAISGKNNSSRILNIPNLLNQIIIKGNILSNKKPFLSGVVELLTSSIETSYLPSIRRNDGSNQYMIGDPGADQKIILSLTRGANRIKNIDRLKNTSAFHRNAPIYSLLKKPNFSESFKHFKFGAITKGSDRLEYSDMAGTLDYTISAMNLFYNSGQKTGYFYGAVNGDGSTATGVSSIKFESYNELSTYLYKSIQQEYRRIIETKEFLKRNPSKSNNYTDNGQMFVMFKFMNKYLSENGGDSLLKEKPDGKILEFIDNELQKRAEEYYDELIKETNENISLALNDSILYDQNYTGANNKDSYINFLKSFEGHNLFFSSQLLTLIQNDPAYYKHSGKPGDVAIDLGKRGKEGHSAVNLNVEAYNENEVNNGMNQINVLILNDVETKTSNSKLFFKALRSPNHKLSLEDSLKKLSDLGGATHTFNEKGELVELIDINEEIDYNQLISDELLEELEKTGEVTLCKTNSKNKFR